MYNYELPYLTASVGHIENSSVPCKDSVSNKNRVDLMIY